MELEILKARLGAAYRYFEEKQHQKNVERVAQLARKLQTGEYGIAFAGHFSAGKSRMINNLLGENLLPSSPIPTSANLVRVHKGEEYARVFFKSGRPRKYLAPYDYDMLRSYCRDGDQIAEIELSRADLVLPEQVVVMDTPGIDSADDAHRAATEAALHLADVILYVMDYNHVQSELNFAFTRELTQAGKEVYLIINQIDKHVADELSFQAFRQGVEKAFEAWGVKPAGYFYTSLKVQEHPDNQFPQLKALLMERIAHSKELLAASLEASLRKIVQEYSQESQEAEQEALAWAEALLGKLDEAKLQEMRADYARLTQEQAQLQEPWTSGFDAGVEQILANAYLMPTSTRDLARDYLEACQPSFKVGFFGRGKKTEAELKRRRDVFLTDAAEKAKAQIEWHIKTYFADFAKENHVDSPELADLIQNIIIAPPEELLTEAMRSGAKLTQDGSYVMNYTQNFAEGTKNVARQAAKEYKAHLAELMAQRQQERGQAIAQQLAKLADYAKAWIAVEQGRQRQTNLKQELQQLLTVTRQPAGFDFAAAFSLEPWEEEICQPMSGTEAQGEPATLQTTTEVRTVEKAISADAQAMELDKQPDTRADEAENKTKAQLSSSAGAERAESRQEGKAALKAWAAKLSHGSSLLAQVPGLQQLSQELAERSQRLNDKGFLVTLFGAFSAGKSSFANSLLGEAILPVSPNPTTAAINKIMPVDEAHPHGTVLIKLKDEMMLLEDVNRALHAFDLRAGSLSDALSSAREIITADKEQGQHKSQREKAFLRAFVHGFEEAGQNLGTILTRNLTEFPAYAAQEEKSCFVDWIQVYYDCPLTQLGITLVDTPGADSINARHTNMSFNYIRQSDVVLFVTYYNHAFSKADREFLIQLGRVKDAFALDKMFFIVNAIDLAEDAAEAAGVVGYVREQLKKYGVRKPQIFGRSSQQVLADKLAGRTEGFEFETAFYAFVFNDLTAMAVNAAMQEYRLAQERLQELLAISQGDAAEKERRREELKLYQQQADSLLNSMSSLALQHSQQQEAKELIYYVKQRVFLRYTDFYREAFNPATLQGKSNSRGQLQNALTELLDSIGFDLAQELRATTLRMEEYIKEALRSFQRQTNEKLLEINSELPISVRDFAFEAGLEYPTAFQDISHQIFAGALAGYKNPKHFFEEGGSKVMAEELQVIFSQQADIYLKAEEELLLAALQQGVEAVFQQVQARFRRRIAEKFQANFAALDGGLPVDELKAIIEQLSYEVEQIKKEK